MPTGPSTRPTLLGNRRRWPRQEVLGFDSVIEAVGGGETVEDAIELAARGGRILVFGVANPNSVASVRPYEVFAKELALIGTVINPYTQGRAVQLLHRLPLGKLPITAVHLDEVSRAFDGSLKGAVKVQIELG